MNPRIEGNRLGEIIGKWPGDEDYSDELLVQTPDRMRCYRLVSAMPESALPEVEESLLGLQEHYCSLAAANLHPQLDPPPQAVTPIVAEIPHSDRAIRPAREVARELGVYGTDIDDITGRRFDNE